MLCAAGFVLLSFYSGAVYGYGNAELSCPESLRAKYAGKQDDVLFTDAAKYESRAAYVAVAVREDGTPMACCTIGGVTTVEAEEMTIALTANQQGVKVVISHSKNALRNYE